MTCQATVYGVYHVAASLEPRRRGFKRPVGERSRPGSDEGAPSNRERDSNQEQRDDDQHCCSRNSLPTTSHDFSFYRMQEFEASRSKAGFMSKPVSITSASQLS